MPTQTINTRQFTDTNYNHGKGEVRLYQHTLTLEEDTSSGVLTLALNGNAVTAVAPATDSTLVAITTAGSSANVAALDFIQLCVRPSGSVAALPPPPNRAPLGMAWDGWALARVMQAGVTLDTALRIGARFG